MIRILGTLFAGLAGLALGSFLNVCATRWPEDEKITKPRSHCRSCGRTLSWWENVPLVSWMALRGRCRTCHEWIGWRYPIAELSVGVLWAYSAWMIFSAAPGLDAGVFSADAALPLVDGIARMIFLWLLVALAVLDSENLWLPDRLTLPGIGLGLLLAIARGTITAETSLGGGFSTWVHTVPGVVVLFWFMGAVIGGGMLLIIRWIYEMVRGMEGIGLGDVKLMAMLGGWVGIKGALLSFAVALLAGLVLALAWRGRPPKGDKAGPWQLQKLPFGTFLCLGGIIAGLWGEAIIRAYMRLSGL
ncbi:MAG: prepilin peptidase [Terracidiphilus sp.]|jgi:leader peptidase (prepilin peptidase)/N-methyltransferase